MFCVVQEIQRKKPNQYGGYRELEAYSPYEIRGRPKYSYRHTGGRFERPIRTAYKISIHESKRAGGVVIKKQYAVTTVGYYDLAESWIGDCVISKKLEAIAASLNTTTDELWTVINAKVDPLQERIKAEFEATPEYETRVKHEKILSKYNAKKAAFAKGWGVDADTYDYCYNIFGEVVNQAYVDQIMAAGRQREQAYSSYRKTASSNYSGYDHSKLFGSTSPTYTAADKERLKKFYKSLSKIYHPDLNHDTDTHAEMVLLNRLKEQWGV